MSDIILYGWLAGLILVGVVARLVREHAEWRRRSQAQAVAGFIAENLTPFRLQDHHEVPEIPGYWKHCLEEAVGAALTRQEKSGSVLRITHNVFERPDPVLLGAARRAFKGYADTVTRALVPVEVWFSRQSVKIRYCNQFMDAGTAIWNDVECLPPTWPLRLAGEISRFTSVFGIACTV